MFSKMIVKNNLKKGEQIDTKMPFVLLLENYKSHFISLYLEGCNN